MNGCGLPYVVSASQSAETTDTSNPDSAWRVNGARFSRSDEKPIVYVVEGFRVDGSILGTAAATGVGVVDGPLVDSGPPQPVAGKTTSPKTTPRKRNPHIRMRFRALSEFRTC